LILAARTLARAAERTFARRASSLAALACCWAAALAFLSPPLSPEDEQLAAMTEIPRRTRAVPVPILTFRELSRHQPETALQGRHGRLGFLYMGSSSAYFPTTRHRPWPADTSVAEFSCSRQTLTEHSYRDTHSIPLPSRRSFWSLHRAGGPTACRDLTSLIGRA
jgi:hypothetical protein